MTSKYITQTENEVSIELPVHFDFPKFTRYFTLIIAILVITYSIFMITQIGDHTTTVKKVLLFVILFLAFESFLRNVTTLNRVTVSIKHLKFSAIAKPSLKIEWENLKKINFEEQKGKTLEFHYLIDGKEKVYHLSLAYKNLVDILFLVKLMANNVELDDFVKELIFSLNEKK